MSSLQLDMMNVSTSHPSITGALATPAWKTSIVMSEPYSVTLHNWAARLSTRIVFNIRCTVFLSLLRHLSSIK